MRIPRVLATVALSIFALLSATVAIASQAPMRITDVRFTDLGDATQIEIVGSQFDNGAAPVVTLDGDPILVNGSSATLIQAELPAGTSDGDYTIGVSTGSGNKQNAEHTLSVAPLEAMSVSCIDWFTTAGHGEHIHNELHVEDEPGDGVIGAGVTYSVAFRTFEDRADGVAPVVFQTNPAKTTATEGHAHGEGCSDPSGTGVTGWYCCIGAGPHDAGETPGKRSCPIGEYSYEILSVEPPPGTTLVWDGETPGPLTQDFVY